MTTNLDSSTLEATYEILSPRGEVDEIQLRALNSRLDTLAGKRIGLFATFKEHWPLIVEEVGRQIAARYPDVELTRFLYPKDLNAFTRCAEVLKDPEFRPSFEQWVETVDAVIVANGDAGSCTLYLAYNAAAGELLGKPTVLMVHKPYVAILQSGAALRGVPGLRYVDWDFPDLSYEPTLDRAVAELIPHKVGEVLDDVVAALTEPLTPEEAQPQRRIEPRPRIVHGGTLEEINEFLYAEGLSYGMPVMPPTPEAVSRMLEGTDLPADHVVARIPPMLGKATVETIAANAAMAGCLPTYMPVLIAAVEALVDPRMWLEGYTCSQASWAPMIMVNGPIRTDIAINSRTGFLSPYYKANAAIAHAVGLIIMNIGGVRPNIEDMARVGHEGRFGICFAEDEESSPWEPMHVYYGLEPEDSAVTVFWPNTRDYRSFPDDAGAILHGICDGAPHFGWDPGCAFIVGSEVANVLHRAGYSRSDLIAYVHEYARKPATGMNLRWLKGNHHAVPGVPLPADGTRSVRKFMSDLHLPVIVAGSYASRVVAFYGGGGDHGGPVTKKIALPESWDALAERYRDRYQRPGLA